MLHTITTIFLTVLFHSQLLGWDLLSAVEIVMGYDEFIGTEVEQPKFSEQLKLREGTELTLEGFIIPLQQEGSQDYFVLSRFPYASCFFCGGAGPETVVEVYSDREFKYTDERVKVTGTLRLNDDNSLHLFYILENSKVVKLD
ncbi:MAG: hypothetical protein HRT61_20180 [Ekhidna sp.]|nr:hypothetical protein [Ekhidna sp.]